MRKTYKSWTKDEDDLLRKVWGTPGSIKAYARNFPDRTVRSVWSRALALNLGGKGPRTEHPNPTRDAVLETLKKHPNLDSVDLAEMTGCSRRSVMTALNMLHGSHIYVSGWIRRSDNGYWARRYSIGIQPDAPRPKPLTAKQLAKRAYARLKKEKPDYLAAKAAKARLRYAEKTGKLIRRDPLVAALFGGA